MIKLKPLAYILSVLFLLSFSAVTIAQETEQEMSEKRKRAIRDSFKLSGGLSFNNINIDSIDDLDPETAIGYNFGLSYKRGRFFYWELGARYNRREFDIVNKNTNETGEFAVTAIDVPITAGINLTSYIDRLVGLRIFASAVPSFTIDSELDDLGFTEDDAEDFNMYAQFGLGIDFTVIFLEAGYNFGFDDIISQGTKSVPNQFFILFGFRL